MRKQGQNSQQNVEAGNPWSCKWNNLALLAQDMLLHYLLHSCQPNLGVRHTFPCRNMSYVVCVCKNRKTSKEATRERQPLFTVVT